MNAEACFSNNYEEARKRFLALAINRGATLTSDVHPMPGRSGELLALDVAVLGQPDATRRLLVSSGCHGIEGFCGAGVQMAALSDSALLAKAREADVTLIFAHALNPYGFSHLRRVTQENVDLNRNFIDFAKPLPSNDGYAALHEVLIPAEWPPTAQNISDLARLFAAHGLRAIQQAVSSGQYTIQDGLFYGGSAPTWSRLAVQRMLRDHARTAAHLGWIDLHSGLGPSGHGERISADVTSKNEASRARAERWWSSEGRTPLKGVDKNTSVSAKLTGTVGNAALEACPNTAVTKLTIEFGTVPILQVLHALRAEQWLALHADADQTSHQSIKQLMLDAFYVNTPEWKTQVVTQGLNAIEQGIVGLQADEA